MSLQRPMTDHIPLSSAAQCIPIKVMLVEDNPDDAKLAEELLAEAGPTHFATTHVERLSTALRRLGREHYDVILLDLSLIDTYGMDTLIQMLSAFPGIPTVVLSGLEDKALQLQALQHGAQDYLVKGQINGDMIARVVHSVIQRKRAEEQSERDNDSLGQMTFRLHNELGPILSRLSSDWTCLTKHLQSGSTSSTSEVSAMLPIISELIDSAVKSVSQLTTSLPPMILYDLGFLAALEWQAGEFQTKTGLSCEITITPDVRALKLTASLSGTLFRIVQELLTNVMRHAHASRVRVALQAQANSLVLDVHDNGVGISEEEKTKSNCHGLLRVSEHAALFRGVVTIQGKPKPGTLVTVRIPHP